MPNNEALETETLARKKEEGDSRTQELRIISDKYDESALRKAEAALKYHENIQAIRSAHQSLLEARLRLIEAKSEISAIEADNTEVKGLLVQSEAAVKELRAKAATLREKYHEAEATVLSALRENPRADEILRIGKETTVMQIESEIEAETVRLESIQAGNPMALMEFDARVVEIKKLETEKAQRDDRLADIDRNIDRIKTQWEPRLDKLIDTINDAFSYNFERVECAGEVSLHKDEDFDKWAIDIKVKFR
jgi:chromosome segregation ATPase